MLAVPYLTQFLFTLSRSSSSGTFSTVTVLAVFEGVALALEIGVVLAEGGELEVAVAPFFLSFFDFFLFPSSPAKNINWSTLTF